MRLQFRRTWHNTPRGPPDRDVNGNPTATALDRSSDPKESFSRASNRRITEAPASRSSIYGIHARRRSRRRLTLPWDRRATLPVTVAGQRFSSFGGRAAVMAALALGGLMPPFLRFQDTNQRQCDHSVRAADGEHVCGERTRRIVRSGWPGMASTGRTVDVSTYDFLVSRRQSHSLWVYNLAHNSAWVFVGIDHDTSVFAVATIDK